MDFNLLESRAGIVFMDGTPKVQTPTMAHDFAGALDADPGLITVSNAGIPAFLTLYQDPRLIDIIVAPMKAVEAVGSEVKKGDWASDTALFQTLEMTGETTAYGDYNESGNAGVNTNFPQRQSFHFQTFTRYGERELERAGLAKMDLANQKNRASALVLNKAQNKSYLFGITGLQNYGMLNDPSLDAALTPITKAAGGTLWTTTAGAQNATMLEVYADINKMFYNLQKKLNGNLSVEDKMTLIMSNKAQIALQYANTYNTQTVKQLIEAVYPNLKFVFVPEYSTDSGELVQLVVDAVNGQPTWECAFTEKMRAHPMQVKSSSFEQKKSCGTWGTIIYMPVGIEQMLGV